MERFGHKGKKRKKYGFILKWQKIVEILDGIQKEMFEKAKESFHKKIMKAEDWKGFMNYINGANIVLTPWYNCYVFLFAKEI